MAFLERPVFWCTGCEGSLTWIRPLALPSLDMLLNPFKPQMPQMLNKHNDMFSIKNKGE